MGVGRCVGLESPFFALPYRWQVEEVKLTIEIDLEQLPDPKPDELGRILRYWGGAVKQIDLSNPVEMPLMDSSYQQVGVLKIL